MSVSEVQAELNVTRAKRAIQIIWTYSDMLCDQRTNTVSRVKFTPHNKGRTLQFTYEQLICGVIDVILLQAAATNVRNITKRSEQLQQYLRAGMSQPSLLRNNSLHLIYLINSCEIWVSFEQKRDRFQKDLLLWKLREFGRGKQKN